jgi:hypothetical protein
VVSNVPVLRHLLQNKSIKGCRHEDAFALRGEFETVETIEEDPRLLEQYGQANKAEINSVLVSSAAAAAAAASHHNGSRNVKPSSPIMRIEARDVAEELKEKQQLLNNDDDDNVGDDADQMVDDDAAADDDGVDESLRSKLGERYHVYHATESDCDPSLLPLKFKTISNIVNEKHGKIKNKKFLHFLHDMELESCISFLKFLAQETKLKKKKSVINNQNHHSSSSSSNDNTKPSFLISQINTLSSSLLINEKLKADALSHIAHQGEESDDGNAMKDDDNVSHHDYHHHHGKSAYCHPCKHTFSGSSNEWYCDNVEMHPSSMLKAVSTYKLSPSQVEYALYWLTINLHQEMSLMMMNNSPNRHEHDDDDEGGRGVVGLRVKIKGEFEEGKNSSSRDVKGRVIKLTVNKKKKGDDKQTKKPKMEETDDDAVVVVDGAQESELEREGKRLKLSHRFQIREGRGQVIQCHPHIYFRMNYVYFISLF